MTKQNFAILLTFSNEIIELKSSYFGSYFADICSPGLYSQLTSIA